MGWDEEREKRTIIRMGADGGSVGGDLAPTGTHCWISVVLDNA
jgi:hypothetical protein